MYAPHTVTLYTVTSLPDPDTLKETVTTNITVLEGVFLDAVKAENVRATGQQSADAATLYIPFGVKAVDGITGEAKPYMGWPQYWASVKEGETADAWTMSTGGNSFFVKGRVVVPDGTLDQIDMSHEGVYVITTVDAKDYGSQSMRHWEVGGR